MFYLKNSNDDFDFEDELTEEDILDILELNDDLKPIDISWEEFFENWDLDYND
jgi:hypothetical protein